MRLLITVLLTSVALGMAACAGSGRDFDSTHAADIQKGVHDKAQMKAWFGPPSQTTGLTGHPAGCTERWTYVHAWSNYGGMKTTTRMLVIDFDERGVVCDHAFVQN